MGVDCGGEPFIRYCGRENGLRRTGRRAGERTGHRCRKGEAVVNGTNTPARRVRLRECRKGDFW